MRYRLWQKIAVCAAPFALLTALYFAAVLILKYFSFLPCPSYTLLHIYCPGCGSTRAVHALTKGNFLLSLRQNFIILAAILICVLLYVELVLKVFGIRFRFPLIHSNRFYLAAGALWAAYAVARNFIPAIAPIPI